VQLQPLVSVFDLARLTHLAICVGMERPLSPARAPGGSGLFRGDSLSSGSGSWSVTSSDLGDLATTPGSASRRHRRAGSGDSFSTPDGCVLRAHLNHLTLLLRLLFMENLTVWHGADALAVVYDTGYDHRRPACTSVLRIPARSRLPCRGLSASSLVCTAAKPPEPNISCHYACTHNQKSLAPDRCDPQLVGRLRRSGDGLFGSGDLSPYSPLSPAAAAQRAGGMAAEVPADGSSNSSGKMRPSPGAQVTLHSLRHLPVVSSAGGVSAAHVVCPLQIAGRLKHTVQP